jgi:hypothetical protein
MGSCNYDIKRNKIYNDYLSNRINIDNSILNNDNVNNNIKKNAKIIKNIKIQIQQKVIKYLVKRGIQ